MDNPIIYKIKVCKIPPNGEMKGWVILADNWLIPEYSDGLISLKTGVFHKILDWGTTEEWGNHSSRIRGERRITKDVVKLDPMPLWNDEFKEVKKGYYPMAIKKYPKKFYSKY